MKIGLIFHFLCTFPVCTPPLSDVSFSAKVLPLFCGRNLWIRKLNLWIRNLMGESSANSMRSPAGAALGRRLLLRFRPGSLSSAALGAVKILLINTTPRERYHANFLVFAVQAQLYILGHKFTLRRMENSGI